MLRLRKLATLLVISCGVSCSGGEQQVADSFLSAVKNGNEKAAKALSVVSFPGKVESWEITEVGPASTEPFNLPELYGKRSELSQERRQLMEENESFQHEHQSAFEEYEAKHEQDPEYEFSGELADFQKQWEGRLEKLQEREQAAIDLDKSISHLRAAASLSVNAGVKEDFEGDVARRELTIRVNDGSTETTHKFTLRKFNIVSKERNLNPIGRWVVTDIS